MRSEICSSSKKSRMYNPKPETLNGGSIERILLRKDRVFALFIGAVLLIAGLLLLAIFLRWDF